MTRLLWIVASGLSALTLLGAAAAWSSLPDLIPHRIGPDGAAEGLAPKSIAGWFLPAVLPVVMLALLAWLSTRMPRWGKGLNAPDADRWMKLPPDARARAFAPIRGMFGAVAIEVALVFGAVQRGMYETAHGRRAEWLLPAVLVTNALMLPLVLGVFLPRFSEAVAAEEQRLNRHAAPGAA